MLQCSMHLNVHLFYHAYRHITTAQGRRGSIQLPLCDWVPHERGDPQTQVHWVWETPEPLLRHQGGVSPWRHQLRQDVHPWCTSTGMLASVLCRKNLKGQQPCIVKIGAMCSTILFTSTLRLKGQDDQKSIYLLSIDYTSHVIPHARPSHFSVCNLKCWGKAKSWLLKAHGRSVLQCIGQG